MYYKHIKLEESLALVKTACLKSPKGHLEEPISIDLHSPNYYQCLRKVGTFYIPMKPSLILIFINFIPLCFEIEHLRVRMRKKEDIFSWETK